MLDWLEKNEYCWKVKGRDRDYYFSSQDLAIKSENTRAGEHMEQVTLYRSGNRYYEVEMTEVYVDIPNKQDILNRLSPSERKVLGIE